MSVPRETLAVPIPLPSGELLEGVSAADTPFNILNRLSSLRIMPPRASDGETPQSLRDSSPCRGAKEETRGNGLPRVSDGELGDLSKDRQPVLHTDRDEICPVLSVVIVF